MAERRLARRLRAQRSAVFLNGEGIPDRDPLGERVVDDSFLLLFNAHHQRDDVHAARRGLRADLAGRRRHRRPAARPRGAQGARRQAGRAAADPGAVVAGAAAPVLTRRPVARVQRGEGGSGVRAAGRCRARWRPLRSGRWSGRRRRRRAARRPGRRAARAPRSRGRARTAGRAPRRARPGRRPAPAAARPRRRWPPAPTSAVRAGEQGEAGRRTGRAWSARRPACRTQACGARSPGRAARSMRRSGGRAGAGDHRRAVRVAQAARQPVGRAALDVERALGGGQPDGPALGVVAVEQRLPGQAAGDPRELPAQLVAVVDRGVQADPGDRRRAVRGVADEEPGPGAVGRGDLGRQREPAARRGPRGRGREARWRPATSASSRRGRPAGRRRTAGRT